MEARFFLHRFSGSIYGPEMGLSKNASLWSKGDDSPQPPILDINRLPGRIGPPQKEEGIFRQSTKGGHTHQP